MILVIGGQKGGGGKTTMATSLAVMRTQHDKSTLLIDGSGTGIATFWAGMRATKNIEPYITCVQVRGAQVGSVAKSLANTNSTIIIDTDGHDTPEFRAGALVADIAFMPINPSIDIWTLAQTNALIDDVKATFNPNIAVLACFNRVKTLLQIDEVKDVFIDTPNIKLISPIVYDRISLQRAELQGRFVGELERKDPKAEIELNEIYQEIFNDR